ncbi:MAG TPA: M20 family metallo-hydrolase [Gaiellaceae bacterium]|nr:M20 family metallo-hydrolase [Gaiellaceae bacterium]
MRIDVDPALVERYVLELARHGAHGETGVWRTVYSPEWVAAQDEVSGWLEQAGLEVRRDAVGNVWGRLPGTDGGPVVATGSHVDSQTPGGRYDGALGLIAAVVALRSLREQLGPPRRTLEAVSLCEEEASRFHATNFWGSRAIVGSIGPDEADRIRDADGTTIGEAMRAVGLDPARIPEAARSDLDTWIELHVEQGPILEEEGLPVGVVDAITAITHYVVELVGRSDHAGARPMKGRLDPMAGFAEIVGAVVGVALDSGPPAVTTVGRVHVEPNLPSAVPDRVTFTLDSRHPDQRAVEAQHADQERLMREIAERRGLAISWTKPLDLPACPCDPGVVATLERAASEQGIPFRRMHSGAGHDTQNMARIAKVAMVFARSEGGRSHTPEEHTSVEDAVAATRVLAGALHRLAY